MENMGVGTFISTWSKLPSRLAVKRSLPKPEMNPHLFLNFMYIERKFSTVAYMSWTLTPFPESSRIYVNVSFVHGLHDFAAIQYQCRDIGALI